MSSMSGEAGSLWLGLVPDHRRDAGKRYPLANLLLIAAAGLCLAGGTSWESCAGAGG